jgi:hypothetical protein
MGIEYPLYTETNNDWINKDGAAEHKSRELPRLHQRSESRE